MGDLLTRNFRCIRRVDGSSSEESVSAAMRPPNGTFGKLGLPPNPDVEITLPRSNERVECPVSVWTTAPLRFIRSARHSGWLSPSPLCGPISFPSVLQILHGVLRCRTRMRKTGRKWQSIDQNGQNLSVINGVNSTNRGLRGQGVRRRPDDGLDGPALPVLSIASCRERRFCTPRWSWPTPSSHGDRERLLGFDAQEHPVALQLGGSHPDKLAQSARIVRILAMTRSISTADARPTGSSPERSVPA